MNSRDEKLDLVRGICALLVLIGHARNFIMVDSEQILYPTVYTKAFYLVTSLHHQAVMAFFVLSGYFVGGSVLTGIKQDRFSWINYAVARLSRLWVVLVPALILTLALDRTGLSFLPDAYNGHSYLLFNSGPLPGQPTRLGLWDFLGNLAFLQGWRVPVFGTNGPLWSLSYEFWYYVLFPLLLHCVIGRKIAKKMRMVSLAILMILLAILPTALVQSGLIWLMGAAVGAAGESRWLRNAKNSWVWQILGGVGLASAVIGAKAKVLPMPDAIVGLMFALWMPALLGPWSRRGWWVKFGSATSEISFSLYIVHFPIMFLLITTALAGRVFQPNPEGMCWFVSVNGVCLIASAAFWWLFESRTDVVRKWVKSRIGGGNPKFSRKTIRL